MLSRLRSHARHNVVGYIALFFALSGVAYAAGPLKAGDPAGGDLTGSTYPDPQLAPNSVGAPEIASGAVGTAEFSNTIPAARLTQEPGFDQFVPNGTLTTFTDWGIEEYDTAALHSTSTNTSRLTAPVAGVYRVSARIAWSFAGAGFAYQMALVKNGVLDQGDIEGNVSATGASANQSTSTELKLAAGDYMEVVARHNVPASLGVFPDAFTMSWVAPG